MVAPSAKGNKLRMKARKEAAHAKAVERAGMAKHMAARKKLQKDLMRLTKMAKRADMQAAKAKGHGMTKVHHKKKKTGSMKKKAASKK